MKQLTRMPVLLLAVGGVAVAGLMGMYSSGVASAATNHSWTVVAAPHTSRFQQDIEYQLIDKGIADAVEMKYETAAGPLRYALITYYDKRWKVPCLGSYALSYSGRDGYWKIVHGDAFPLAKDKFRVGIAKSAETPYFLWGIVNDSTVKSVKLSFNHRTVPLSLIDGKYFFTVLGPNVKTAIVVDGLNQTGVVARRWSWWNKQVPPQKTLQKALQKPGPKAPQKSSKHALENGSHVPSPGPTTRGSAKSKEPHEIEEPDELDEADELEEPDELGEPD